MRSTIGSVSIAETLANGLVLSAMKGKPMTRIEVARRLGINETYARTRAPQTKAYKAVIAKANHSIEERNKTAVAKMLNIRDTALDKTSSALQGNVELRDAVNAVDTINSNIMKLTGKDNSAGAPVVNIINFGSIDVTPNREP